MRVLEHRFGLALPESSATHCRGLRPTLSGDKSTALQTLRGFVCLEEFDRHWSNLSIVAIVLSSFFGAYKSSGPAIFSPSMA